MAKINIVIAIDGPAGSGKSTLGKSIAKELGLLYIDSGAMYRAFGLKCHINNVPPNDTEAIKNVIINTTIDLKNIDGVLHTFLDGKDVSTDIRTAAAGKAASIYSTIPEVRVKLIDMQRALAKNNSVVMDGRDIGSVVFPEASLKIFLDASAEIRAERRYLERFGTSPDKNNEEYKTLLADIKARDKMDSEREISPLIRPEDAIILDTSKMSIEEVHNRVINLARDL